MNLIPWRNKQDTTALSEAEAAPPVDRFRSEMGRILDRFFGEPFGGLEESTFPFGGWGPSLDLSETDTHVIVKAEMPGVDSKDVDISLSGNVLTISGQKNESSERREGRCYHSERRFGSFRRSVQLPAYVDTDKTSAEQANGVLTIQLAKLPSATPKRVAVKAT